MTRGRYTVLVSGLSPIPYIGSAKLRSIRAMSFECLQFGCVILSVLSGVCSGIGSWDVGGL